MKEGPVHSIKETCNGHASHKAYKDLNDSLECIEEHQVLKIPDISPHAGVYRGVRCDER